MPYRLFFVEHRHHLNVEQQTMEPLGYLYLPDPASLDPRSVVKSVVVREVAERFVGLTPPTSSKEKTYDEQLAELARQVKALCRRLEDVWRGLAAMPVRRTANEKNACYDAHFHVRRIEANTADTLVVGTVLAFAEIFEDSQQRGTSLLPVEVAHLFAAAQLIVGLWLDRGESDDEIQ